MANTDYSITRDNIITEALELLGALEAGGTVASADSTSLSRTLNMLIKHWQSQGINIYAVRETFLFLIDGKHEYKQIDFNGTTGFDVDRNHIYAASYQAIAFAESTTTEVTVDEAFISGTPVADAGVGDIIGIPQDDGTVHWAEITAVGTNGDFSKSYTFANHAMSASTDPDTDKNLIVAVDYPGRPIKIMSAARRHIFDESDSEIEVVSITDYNRLSSKSTSEGPPNQVMYNRETTIGDIRVWPKPADDNYALVLWVQLPLADIESDAALNANDGFPQEYFLALSYSLAEAAIPKYGPPRDVAYEIRRLAGMYRDEAFTYDTEEGFQIQPETH